ncbi:hypothetical protein HY634_00940 [Candidatus Uhrbacteria bacterium]|nr:hypothetical protein [Candidatus Uhrbacteria bacterium]
MLVFMLLAPFPAAAVDPQLDPTCWPKEQCEGAGGGFEVDPACQSETWGRCYAQKAIPIQVKLPGLAGQEVKDIGQYVTIIYVWAVRVAAVLAVVVIMVGGIMWLTSGGAERLGKAKELIGNAVIGLLLAVGSYVVLQTINPDLVRLSLPRTRMVRAIAAGATFCSGVPAEVPIHDGGPTGAQVAATSRGRLPCGFAYHTPTASAKTCLGDFCDPGRVCLPGGTRGYECVEGSIAGEVGGDTEAYLDNDIELHVVCSNGSDHEILSTDGKEVVAGRRHSFAFSKRADALRAIESACGGSTGEGTVASSTVRGFTLWLEVNDDEAFGVGNDDWYAVGGAALCGGSAAKPISSMPSDEGDPSSIVWRSVADDAFIPQMTVYAALRQPRTGFPATPLVCRFALNRSNFPGR